MKHLFQNFLLWFLRTATHLQLAKNQPLIVGVTGSAGKSSAVKAIGMVLQTQYRVFYTKKGNSETGLCLEILSLPVENYSSLGWLKVMVLSCWQLLTYWPSYKVLVAEMAIDSEKPPKNMSYLLKIVQPKIGVFLNVSSVHGQNFSGSDIVQSIANEKGKLLQSLPADGLAVFSNDHPQLVKLTKHLQAAHQTFAHSHPADMKLLKHEVSLVGTTFTFQYQTEKHVLKFTDQLYFAEAFGTFAAALLVGQHLGVSILAGITQLEKHYTLYPGRMSIFAGVHGSTIIDSSYNSSLEATAATLRMLKEIPTKGRRIAVLGDMRELGQNEATDHQQLAQVAAQTADIIILVGQISQKYALPYLQKHLKKQTVYSFITAWEAVATLQELVKKSDLVLVKGSQNTIFLEIVVEALLANPSSDRSKLCRRGEYWDQQRTKLKQSA